MTPHATVDDAIAFPFGFLLYCSNFDCTVIEWFIMLPLDDLWRLIFSFKRNTDVGPTLFLDVMLPRSMSNFSMAFGVLLFVWKFNGYWLIIYGSLNTENTNNSKNRIRIFIPLIGLVETILANHKVASV